MERTPSETLMTVLEDFGVSEPKNVIVIWLNQNNELNWSRANSSVVEALGMVRAVEVALEAGWVSGISRDQ